MKVGDNKFGHVRDLARSLKESLEFIQWNFLVPSIGGRYHIIPQLAVYRWYYIPLIYCVLGDYISPIPPIKGTRNSYWFMGYWEGKKPPNLDHFKAGMKIIESKHHFSGKIFLIFFWILRIHIPFVNRWNNPFDPNDWSWTNWEERFFLNILFSRYLSWRLKIQLSFSSRFRGCLVYLNSQIPGCLDQKHGTWDSCFRLHTPKNPDPSLEYDWWFDSHPQSRIIG